MVSCLVRPLCAIEASAHSRLGELHLDWGTPKKPSHPRLWAHAPLGEALPRLAILIPPGETYVTVAILAQGMYSGPRHNADLFGRFQIAPRKVTPGPSEGG